MFVDPTGEILISTLIIGGIVGVAIGVTTSIVSQGFTKGWENINAQQVVFDGVLGAVSGVIGASGIGVVGSMIWGGTLNFAGSIGSDLIANDGNWEDVNWGKAFAMAAIGVGFGRWAGAGAQNTKAMCQAINEGKSWGAKIFNSFSGNVSSRATSQ